MSSRVEETYRKADLELENAKNKIYSKIIPPLIEMVKALYKEFQELLEPEEVVELFFGEKMPSVYKFSKDGVKTEKGKMISGEEYVERSLEQEKDDDQKFLKLSMLLGEIKNWEINQNKKLKGKYLLSGNDEFLRM